MPRMDRVSGQTARALLTGIENERHALYVGAVAGTITRRSGMKVSVDVTTYGDYTNRLTIEITPYILVHVHIPPPPMAWSITDWMPG